MKKGILLFIVIGMFGWAVYDFVGSADESSKDDSVQGNKITSPAPEEGGETIASDEVGLEKGEIAPEFKLKTPEGKTVHLSDYKGKRVLLNFWATWCPPCRAEIPDLQKLYDNDDVVVLAVNMTASEKNEETVLEFIEEFEMTFPVVMDADSDVTDMYKIHAYPTSYMIDSNGRIQFIGIGAMNYDLMRQELEKME